MSQDRLPTLLSLNAGYVDTAGFLTLHGLFASHVTGNFVTFGAALAQGTTGAVTKLLALPVFCIVILLARLASFQLTARAIPVLPAMLSLKAVLLVVAAGLAVWLGPFPDGDSLPALVTGMTLVSAMALQNGLHRAHMASIPPSTVMTGTTTQVMLDLGDVMHGVSQEARGPIMGRLRAMIPAVVAFAAGCALAALLYIACNVWCFLVPAAVGLLMCWLQWPAAKAAVSQ